MDNNRIVVIITFLIFLILLSTTGFILTNYELKKVKLELENNRQELDVVHDEYLKNQTRYDLADSLLNSSLSAKIYNTYITNIYKNEAKKKDIVTMDSSATDSLFALNLQRSRKRYSYLFDD